MRDDEDCVVSIPSDRVLVSMQVKQQLKQQKMQGLNPLRSGLGFNSSLFLNKNLRRINVSIPSDRVLVSIP